MTNQIWKTTETYIEYIDTSTGQIKKIMLATDAQLNYLNQLRSEMGKQPLKNRPTVFAAKKAIDKALKKLRQLKLF